jgi:hypothetical protein
LEGGGLMVDLLRSARASPGPATDPQAQQSLFKVGLVVDFDDRERRRRSRGDGRLPPG